MKLKPNLKPYLEWVTTDTKHPTISRFIDADLLKIYITLSILRMPRASISLSLRTVTAQDAHRTAQTGQMDI